MFAPPDVVASQIVRKIGFVDGDTSSGVRRSVRPDAASVPSSVPAVTAAAASAAAYNESNDVIVRQLLQSVPSAALLQHQPKAAASSATRCFGGIFESALANPSPSSTHESAPRRLEASGAEMHGHRGDHSWPAPLMVVESNVVARPVCGSLGKLHRFVLYLYTHLHGILFLFSNRVLFQL